MRVRRIGIIGALAAACVTTPLCAAFLGLVVDAFEEPEWRENGYEGLATYRLYALFDGEGDDGVLTVFGLEHGPPSFRTYNDWFYNDRLGDIITPDDLRKSGYWSNLWDTFVTIGGRYGDDATGVPPTECEPESCLCHGGADVGGWFVTPDDDQSIADEDGRVLLGQFTIIENSPGIEFTVNLLLRDGRQVEGLSACTPPQATGPVRLLVDCPPPSCPADIDVNFAVDIEDLLAILAAWGECNGCPADLDCSFDVDLEDLLAVLAAWGPCE